MATIGIHTVSNPNTLLTHTETVFREYTDKFATNNNFDPEIAQIPSMYIFGSFVQNNAIPHVSDLDIAICVESWKDTESNVDFITFTKSISQMIRESNKTHLPPEVETTLTRLDIWIAEPEYNTSFLRESAYQPIYMQTHGVTQPSEAARIIEKNSYTE